MLTVYYLIPHGNQSYFNTQRLHFALYPFCLIAIRAFITVHKEPSLPYKPYSNSGVLRPFCFRQLAITNPPGLRRIFIRLQGVTEGA